MLFSGIEFQGATIGLAYVGAACDPDDSSAIVQANHYTNLAFDAATTAHEIGHSLGMCHDPPASRSSSCTQSTFLSSFSCAGFVMASSADPNNPTSRFSDCSNADMQRFLHPSASIGDCPPLNQFGSCTPYSTTPKCLVEPNPVRSYFNTSVCGNGFIEAGEQCDCGFANCVNAPSPFTDRCCNGTSCKLFAGAQCASTQSCCTSNCTVVPASDQKVCRSPLNNCEDEGVCNGASGACPAIIIRGDGIDCSTSENFLSKNWQYIVAGVGGFLGLLILYKVLHHFCCSSKAEERKAIKAAKTASLKEYRNQQVRGAPQNPNSAGGNADVQMSAPAQVITLPPNWTVRFGPDGNPVYVNTSTGETYDFRSLPKGAQVY